VEQRFWTEGEVPRYFEDAVIPEVSEDAGMLGFLVGGVMPRFIRIWIFEIECCGRTQGRQVFNGLRGGAQRTG
jgi:hypothetical protein